MVSRSAADGSGPAFARREHVVDRPRGDLRERGGERNPRATGGGAASALDQRAAVLQPRTVVGGDVDEFEAVVGEAERVQREGGVESLIEHRYRSRDGCAEGNGAVDQAGRALGEARGDESAHRVPPGDDADVAAECLAHRLDRLDLVGERVADDPPGARGSGPRERITPLEQHAPRFVAARHQRRAVRRSAVARAIEADGARELLRHLEQPFATAPQRTAERAADPRRVGLGHTALR